jgi:hypothetical protein
VKSGYSVRIGAGVASLHPNGALTFEAGGGRAFELPAEDVETLAALLAMGGGLRSQAKRKRQRVRSAVSQNTVTPTASRGVTTHSDAERARLRDAIVTVYRDTQGAVNVTQEAAKLGISRGLWYKLRDEAQARGLLP